MSSCGLNALNDDKDGITKESLVGRAGKGAGTFTRGAENVLIEDVVVEVVDEVGVNENERADADVAVDWDDGWEGLSFSADLGGSCGTIVDEGTWEPLRTASTSGGMSHVPQRASTWLFATAEARELWREDEKSSWETLEVNVLRKGSASTREEDRAPPFETL
jgi:hypothetical protein